MEAAAPGVDGDDRCWVEARSDPPLLYPWSRYVHGDDECWVEGAGCWMEAARC